VPEGGGIKHSEVEKRAGGVGRELAWRRKGYDELSKNVTSLVLIYHSILGFKVPDSR
jgi:hypothetical protein